MVRRLIGSVVDLGKRSNELAWGSVIRYDDAEIGVTLRHWILLLAHELFQSANGLLNDKLWGGHVVVGAPIAPLVHPSTSQ